jgi:hypothetical protein
MIVDNINARHSCSEFCESTYKDGTREKVERDRQTERKKRKYEEETEEE